MTRGTFVRHEREGWYGIVRHEAPLRDIARLCVKPVADSDGRPVTDIPQVFCLQDDLTLAEEASVPWFKLRIVHHINGNPLFYWESPSGEPICECDSLWFTDGCAVSMCIYQI